MYFVASLSFFIIVASTSQLAFSSELCKGGNSGFWYDAQSGKCQPCNVCEGKLLVLEPCSEFMNTLCVDPVEISRSIDRSKEDGRNNFKQTHKWHEMEGLELVQQQSDAIPTKSFFGDFGDQWASIVLMLLCIGLVVAFVIILTLYTRSVIRYRSEARKNIARARLFSRDRLNTTEYMNNLATLDRRLAMDEILEKRKKAIFEPHLLQENLYADEVFVDLSGLPRRQTFDEHEYDEIDHRRCLLRIQDQQ